MTDHPPARQQTRDAASSSDIAKIASGLSRAQRNKLLDLGWPDRSRHQPIDRRVRLALVAAHLLQPTGKPSEMLYELTPLGTSVREHILKGQEGC